jgi:hypothetical protein
MKNYYVEYLNSGEFNNLFCDKKTVDTLKRCKHIKILCFKRANKRTDKWEEITA